MWSRDRDVVLVGRTIKLGKPWGDENLEWGGNGEGEVSLRATWDQGGRDRTTQEEGFQVSRRVQGKEGISKGNWQRETSKGNNKELRHNLVLLIYVCVS
jgi:hypothetical protein